ncbi:MAG: sodium:solute symporter family protein [Pelotomaculaceae bacterium]|jgi:SSS family solute:Na+ symporter|uniref:Na+/proline symporter n=1 Tax=anaerobic digester metagenome TaxID=1263854 RepID=A0A485M848_9ZZZZ|nr:sodium:solute symporter family protein [Bacillota bacterium]HHU86413.1 sodium:solute symporter family protein [Peptococcaceae bacterium]
MLPALTSGHIAGIIVTLCAVTLVGIYAGRMVKSALDFSVGGRRAGATVVAGTIMGTLVGGSSTIGTAQLAFQYGLCAWWFTLGAGLACAVLGLGLARRLHESALETAPQYLVSVYGERIGPVASIFSSAGIYLNIIAQGLAAVALLTSMFRISPVTATLIGVCLVLAYVFFGGVWGTGLVGVAKLGLLYLATLASGALAYQMTGGWPGLRESFPAYPWFSLFGRGIQEDLAAGFSLLVGVLSTQTYIQAIYSARSLSKARTGALLSAFMIPPVGIGGILVGLFMRSNFPNTPSQQVLPFFVMNYLPPFLAGVVLATLLVAVIGTWAGLTLGVSTMLTKDIYKRFIRSGAGSREILTVQRLLILLVCGSSIFFVAGNLKSLILGWSFLSMGLRGCTILFPLLGAMFFPRAVTPLAGTMAALAGPAADLAWHFLYPEGLDPLYAGLLASLLTLVLFSPISRRRVPFESNTL